MRYVRTAIKSRWEKKWDLLALCASVSIPDFASTAFMMQGNYLRAALVDCGGVNVPETYGCIVNTYMKLSRVKKVHGLGLLRKLSPELFITSVALVPHCLIKCRRYTVDDAHAVYTYRLIKNTR